MQDTGQHHRKFWFDKVLKTDNYRITEQYSSNWHKTEKIN